MKYYSNYDYFLKFKDEQKWIKVIGEILVWIWILPAYAAVSAMSYNETYGTAGLIFSALVFALGCGLKRYAEHVAPLPQQCQRCHVEHW